MVDAEIGGNDQLRTARRAVRLAAALGEELTRDDRVLVIRADLRAEVNGLKYWMLSRTAALLAIAFSIALTIVGLMIRYLPPAS